MHPPLRWQDIDFENAIFSVRAANSKTGGQRYSYATYYLKARCGELPRLQLNMGHRSAQLLYSRYVNMAGTTRDLAENWWRILPPNSQGARG